MNNDFFDTRFDDLYMEEDEEKIEDMDVEEDAGLSDISNTETDEESTEEEGESSSDEEDTETDDDFKDTFNKAKSDELGNSDVITSKNNPSFVDKDTEEEPPEPAEDSDDDVKLKNFGSDSGSYESPHNDYDEEELKILDDLISDENHAVDRYFDAVKNTEVRI